MFQKLPHTALRWKFEDFDLVKSAVRQRRKSKHARLGALSQERALSALELGLGIRQRGYNIFVVGPSGTGRSSTVNQMLHERAAKEATPDDIVLLYNFDNRDRPLAISVPPSSGPKLKKTYDSLIERLLIDLEKTFESEHHLLLKQQIQDDCRERTDDVLNVIEDEAKDEGFLLQRGAGALTLTPANKSGGIITEEEFDSLEDDEKHALEQSAEKLEGRLEDAIRRVRAIEKEADDALEQLEKETARVVMQPLFESAKNAWKNHKTICAHLEAVREDALNRLRRLVPDERAQPQDQDNQNQRSRLHEEEEDLDSDEPLFLRFRVNVLVTHAKSAGAPVVQETHPTSSNLIGRIEQKVRAGETVTDHTRIRAGALYRANGGYLVLEANELLRDPSAWEGLKRALKNRAIELDDPGEPGRMVSLASLRPEPIALALKVVLIGTPDLYYALSKNDPDFGKLFKVKADFDVEMDRSKERISRYLQFLGELSVDEGLKALTPQGAGRILEEAVRLAGNQKKLTNRLGDIADLMRESNYWANKEKARHIDAKHVRKALFARSEREGFLEQQMIEDILEGHVSIETQGEVIGQANALTVVELGSYEFGVPLRVTCRVGSGRGEIIDVERETSLGGPIHTKGTLIIRGLLADRFGQEIPLGFNASICMEQTYSDVDGDSASLAEACTLMSVLADAPISQHFAITGSVDQRGRVQSVGGVNEKIEGFFRVCKARGGKTKHGIILPYSNRMDIMLHEDVVRAAEEGLFDIYVVDSIEDALKIVTGCDWEKGSNALRPRILKKLEHFQKLRHKGHLSYLEDDLASWKAKTARGKAALAAQAEER